MNLKINMFNLIKEKKKIKGHGYAKFYEKYLKNLKDLPINILEIGSFHGNASAGFFFTLEKQKFMVEIYFQIYLDINLKD